MAQEIIVLEQVNGGYILVGDGIDFGFFESFDKAIESIENVSELVEL